MKQYLLKVWMTAALSLLALGGVWGQESYTPGYPNVSDITHESATLNVSASVGGTVNTTVTIPGVGPISISYATHEVRFIVLSENDPAPLIEEVKAWSGDGNGGAIEEGLYGTISLKESGAAFSFQFQNLPSSANFLVYLVTVEYGEDKSLVIEDEISSGSATSLPLNTLPPPTPLTATLSPADDATNVHVSTSTFEITFSEDVEFTDSGSARLFKDGSYLEALELLSENGNTVISGNTLTLTFINSLAYSSDYYITIPNNSLQSVSSGVLFGGIAAGEWSFTTEAEPDPLLMNASSLSPENSSDEVPRAPTLEVSFNQAITWGSSGVLTIHRYDNGATAATISRGGTGATISQNKLSIIFSSDSLEYGTKYYVIIDEGFVKALNTSAVFAGLSDKTDWTFTTETAPPFWEEGYPSITNQSIDGFEFNAWADNSGVYYGVVTMSSTAPSVEQIEQGLNHGGTAARIAFNEVVNNNTNPSFTSVSFNSNTELGNTYFLHAVYKSNSRSEERRVG